MKTDSYSVDTSAMKYINFLLLWLPISCLATTCEDAKNSIQFEYQQKNGRSNFKKLQIVFSKKETIFNCMHEKGIFDEKVTIIVKFKNETEAIDF